MPRESVSVPSPLTPPPLHTLLRKPGPGGERQLIEADAFDRELTGAASWRIALQSAATAGDLRELVHRVLHDGGNRQVEGVHSFASLEVDIRILRGSAKDWAIGRERACAMLLY